jgi:hypothetical protein
VRLSRATLVFVRAGTAPDDLNLLQAAIGRVAAVRGTSFIRDPGSRDFRGTYCDGGWLPEATGRTLPWFLTVSYSSPGAFPALAAEVRQLPGVVAVQRFQSDE